MCLLLNRAFPASLSKVVGSSTGLAILDVVGRPIGFQERVHSWSVIVIAFFGSNMVYSSTSMTVWPFSHIVCPILSATLLLFLAALGVPLSWEKVRMGGLQPWIGWSFHWGRGFAELPDNKRQTLLGLLTELTTPGRKVPRKTGALHRHVGVVLWWGLLVETMAAEYISFIV